MFNFTTILGFFRGKLADSTSSDSEPNTPNEPLTPEKIEHTDDEEEALKRLLNPAPEKRSNPAPVRRARAAKPKGSLATPRKPKAQPIAIHGQLPLWDLQRLCNMLYTEGANPVEYLENPESDDRLADVLPIWTANCTRRLGRRAPLRLGSLASEFLLVQKLFPERLFKQIQMEDKQIRGVLRRYYRFPTPECRVLWMATLLDIVTESLCKLPERSDRIVQTLPSAAATVVAPA
jgi:hypothetical protein